MHDAAANAAFDHHYLQLAGEGPDGTGAYRVTAVKGSAYAYAWTCGLTVTNDTLFGRDDYGFGLVAPSAVALPLTLVIDTLGQYLSANDESSITVSNLVYRSNTQVSRSYHAITVLGSYAPESSTYAPMVQLGDATHLSPTLDLSEWAGTFNAGFGGGLTFTEGTTVSVKVGSRHVPRKVIGWMAGTGPANVNFVLDDAVGRLTVESDGVYRPTGLVIIVK